MKNNEAIKVTSHVGRDLLAAAATFKTEAAAVWEYVVNSLQYVDDGVLPKVQVIIKPRAKIIEVRDNGRGMSDEGLKRYFQMHGENFDRLRGRPGRGKFGTGKSAAFGIGARLRIDTRRNGKRNVVSLDRGAIENSRGDDIDTKWEIQNEPIDFPNGTTVTIEEIFLPKLNSSPIIEYIERHLQIFRARMPEVAVNDHVCQYREPNVVETFTFQPNEEQSDVLGNVTLTVKVSASPLPKAEQGVAITAGLGNLVAVETVGVDAKELGNYLFGDIDVPALEDSKSKIEPYDSTRSLQLNPMHSVSRVLLPFIGSKLEEVRKKQARKLREAKKSEEARRLANEASKIAKILNNDFKEIIGRLQDIRAASARPGDLSAHFGDSNTAGADEDLWVEGLEAPGAIDKPSGPIQDLEPNVLRPTPPKPDPNITPTGEPDKSGIANVDPAGGSGKKRGRPRGGFNVDFRALGDDADRSQYDRTSLTILINLDHPVVKNALQGGHVEDLNFRRLAYEIAFTEYAVALGYATTEQDPDIPADEVLFDVRATVNRISKSAAGLYA